MIQSLKFVSKDKVLWIINPLSPLCVAKSTDLMIRFFFLFAKNSRIHLFFVEINVADEQLARLAASRSGKL